MIIIMLLANTVMKFIETKDLSKSLPTLLAALGLSVFLAGNALHMYLPSPYDKLVYTSSMVTFAILVIVSAYLSGGVMKGGIRGMLSRLEGKMFLLTILIAVTYATLYLLSLTIFRGSVIQSVVTALLIPFHIIMGSLMVTFLLLIYKRTEDLAYIFLLTAFVFYSMAPASAKWSPHFSSVLRFVGDLFLLMGIFLSQSGTE